ncbi:hypothetical protein [Sphingomonas morindae]|uniref:Uncharacterized protein n=1 Tax=Sphingomonas morindae TaxID=1541170 RepID=A0ABY4X8C1_9SPHN|nr:hypothetical protein [Sphingomonas morindae]USI73182.1 hypothetical protein LHA26_01480 [Sphingomonas morindae]
MSDLEQIAFVVGADLGAIEHAHLSQVEESVALISNILAAGKSLKVPFATQQKILSPALAAIAKLSEVGHGYAETHQHLSAFVRRHGLDPRAFGESDSGPRAEHGAAPLPVATRARSQAQAA